MSPPEIISGKFKTPFSEVIWLVKASTELAVIGNIRVLRATKK